MLIELRSEDLHNQSLGQLLTMLVEAAQARTNAIITISRMDIVELPNDIAMDFYRIAREAINNIIVHSEASQMNIYLIAEQGQVELRIQDDGLGFDPQTVGEGHLGIRIMKERAAMFGGNLRITSKPDQGTNCCYLVRSSGRIKLIGPKTIKVMLVEGSIAPPER